MNIDYNEQLSLYLLTRCQWEPVCYTNSLPTTGFIFWFLYHSMKCICVAKIIGLIPIQYLAQNHQMRPKSKVRVHNIINFFYTKSKENSSEYNLHTMPPVPNPPPLFTLSAPLSLNNHQVLLQILPFFLIFCGSRWSVVLSYDRQEAWVDSTVNDPVWVNHVSRHGLWP